MKEAKPGALEHRLAEERPADAKVAMVGLGYVGLPLAISFVEAGLDVGVDVWEPCVRELNDGHSPAGTSDASSCRVNN